VHHIAGVTSPYRNSLTNAAENADDIRAYPGKFQNALKLTLDTFRISDTI
jgi:hypothetical protein